MSAVSPAPTAERCAVRACDCVVAVRACGGSVDVRACVVVADLRGYGVVVGSEGAPGFSV